MIFMIYSHLYPTLTWFQRQCVTRLEVLNDPRGICSTGPCLTIKPQRVILFIADC